MPETQSERFISEINDNVFFSEFTFSKNCFKEINSNHEVEFADNVVWLDDMLFIIQIKERNSAETSGKAKWFKNKVLNKAVKQIKNTHKYLNSLSDVTIQNLKGHKRNIITAKSARKRNLIIYSPGPDFEESLRSMKFYQSSELELIHLFHLEDYQWICKYLYTPAEIEEYFIFRENFYNKQGRYLDSIPESYLLAHFFETSDIDHIDFGYLENLQEISHSGNSVFDISFIIRTFTDHLGPLSDPTEYYPIIEEIAKLNRAELTEFKIRFLLSCQDAEEEERVSITPYRIYVPRTDCAFVFIPLSKPFYEHWKTALNEMTFGLMDKEKSSRCVGVCIFYTPGDNQHLETKWQFVEDRLRRNSEIDR